MVTFAQPVVSLAPTSPLALVVSNENQGQLALTTGGSAGAVTSVLGLTGAVRRIPYPAVPLTDAATIAVDASLGNRFTVTLGGSGTLASPTNPADGQPLILEVKQDGVGGRTLAYGTAYEFSSSLPAPTLSTAPGAADLLGFIYSASAGKWRFVAVTTGFAS